jgi:nicotinate dehydrogenase subunit B
MPGVVEVVRDGSFLGVITRREEQARAAAARLATTATWDKGSAIFAGKDVFTHLLTAPSEVKVIHEVKRDAVAEPPCRRGCKSQPGGCRRSIAVFVRRYG